MLALANGRTALGFGALVQHFAHGLVRHGMPQIGCEIG